jgi:hypothetical protein
MRPYLPVRTTKTKTVIVGAERINRVMTEAGEKNYMVRPFRSRGSSTTGRSGPPSQRLANFLNEREKR